MRLLGIISLLFIGTAAFAFCMGGIRKSTLDSLELVEKTALIGAEDTRQTYSEYANEINSDVDSVKKKFAATQQFHCGGFTQNANFICKQGSSCDANTLVLNFHAFHDLDLKNGKCKKLPDLQKCYVEIDSNMPRSKKYYIDPNTVHLFTSCSHFEDAKDVALVRLKESVPGIHPYEVNDPSSGLDAMVNSKTATVSAYNGRFKRYSPNTPAIDHTCSMRRLIPINGGQVYANDCSAENGSSGAANLIDYETDHPKIFGIFGQSFDSNRDHVAFGPHNYTETVPFPDEFYSTLESM